MNALNQVTHEEHGMPPCLGGFEHVNRYWDPVNQTWAAKILPGEYYVSVHDELITTVLGSCISVCIRDKVRGIGGMNHFMLPSNDERDSSWNEKVNSATRYGNHAMEHLINDILKVGGNRRDLEAKMFGGGHVLKIELNIGGKNADFARHYLAREGLNLVAEDVEGKDPRKIQFYPRSGRARVKKLRKVNNNTIARREQQYFRNIERVRPHTDVELF